MHVLNEMHRLLRDQIVLAMPLFCRATVPWEPGSRDHPTILHDSLTSRLLLHRYLCELPEPICCRGIIFGYVAVASFSVSSPWHPFCSAMATNALYHAHVNVFLKLHKLAYVIRIMITTFKMFIFVVSFKLLNMHMVIFRNCCLLFRPQLNLPK